MKLLQHIRYPLVTLMTAADIRFPHPVRLVFPGISAGSQDHKSK